MKKSKTYTTIQINIPDKILFPALLMAHEENITFNQWCGNILRDYIKDYEKPK